MQDYTSGNYNDYGKKTMLWKFKDGRYFILNEEWYAQERPTEIQPPDIPPQPPVVEKPPILPTWAAHNGQVPYEYINFLFPSQPDYDEYLIIVEKRDQQAALYKFGKNYKQIELLKAYPISSGQSAGNKSERGDLKTPEGLYKTIQWIPEANLEPKYGSGAFVLNYPNQMDRLLRKTGSGIWIHGSDMDIIPTDTEGCVRFENQEIVYFHEKLKFNKVPVIINDGLEWTDIDALEKEVGSIQAILKSWQESWQQQDIGKYLSFYCSDTFISYSPNRDYAQWAAHKSRLFAAKNKISVDLYNFEYHYADKKLLVTFYQDYAAPSLKSFGKKQLLLRRDKDTWTIVQEEFVNTSRPNNFRGTTLSGIINGN
jgi:murein L,D-transpeptidase YafK